MFSSPLCFFSTPFYETINCRPTEKEWQRSYFVRFESSGLAKLLNAFDRYLWWKNWFAWKLCWKFCWQNHKANLNNCHTTVSIISILNSLYPSQHHKTSENFLPSNYWNFQTVFLIFVHLSVWMSEYVCLLMTFSLFICLPVYLFLPFQPFSKKKSLEKSKTDDKNFQNSSDELVFNFLKTKIQIVLWNWKWISSFTQSTKSSNKDFHQDIMKIYIVFWGWEKEFLKNEKSQRMENFVDI